MIFNRQTFSNLNMLFLIILCLKLYVNKLFSYKYKIVF